MNEMVVGQGLQSPDQFTLRRLWRLLKQKLTLNGLSKPDRR